jgi:type I site-specific restriction-modification system R (restriction) subunit
MGIFGNSSVVPYRDDSHYRKELPVKIKPQNQNEKQNQVNTQEIKYIYSRLLDENVSEAEEEELQKQLAKLEIKNKTLGGTRKRSGRRSRKRTKHKKKSRKNRKKSRKSRKSKNRK